MLEHMWRDIKNGDDIKFWKEQWDKHGKASNLDQVAYFIKACNLMLNNRLDEQFYEASIHKSPNPQSISFIKSSLAKEMNGVEPILVCLGSENNHQLAQVRSCMNMTDHYVSCGIGVRDLDCDPSQYVVWE